MHFIHKIQNFEEYLHKIALFFKNFSLSLSLFDQSRLQINFLSFSFDSFARFLSSYIGKTFIPLLFHLFSFLMHFFMHLRVIFLMHFTNAPISFPYLFICSLIEVHRSSSIAHALFFPIFSHWILLHLGLDEFPASEPVHIIVPIGATFLRQRAA